MSKTFNCEKCGHRWTSWDNVSSCTNCAGLGPKDPACTCPHARVGLAILATLKTGTNPTCPIHGEKTVVEKGVVVEEPPPHPVAFVARGLNGYDQYYEDHAKDLVAKLMASPGPRKFNAQIFDSEALAIAFLFSQPGSEWERTLVFMSSYGLQTARRIKEEHPKLHVVVLWGGVVPSSDVLVYYKKLLGAGDIAEIFVPH